MGVGIIVRDEERECWENFADGRSSIFNSSNFKLEEKEKVLIDVFLVNIFSFFIVICI